MGAEGARASTYALEVEVRWRGGAALAQEYVWPLSTYLLCDGPIEARKRGFTVSHEWIGQRERALVRVEGERALLCTPGGELELAPGETCEIGVGPLDFSVRLSEALAPAVALRKGERSVAATRSQLGSFAFHGLMLACMALLPPKASSMNLDRVHEPSHYARYLAMPVATEPLPWEGKGAHDGAGEQQTDAGRNAGDEGAAGKERAPAVDKRLAVRGKDKARMPAKLDASAVRSLNMLGALAAAAQGLSEGAYGGEQPLGYDAVDALGKLFGAQPGESFGLGGLGMRGTGRRGGGTAEGTIGVGQLGTGGAARGAPGSHTLSSPKHTARVPQLRAKDPIVAGSLSKEVIRRVIHRHLNEVRFCYQQALASRPDLAGRIRVDFLIAPSGAVGSAQLGESTLGHAEAAACVVSAVRRWSFPAPDGGGLVRVSYPFSFEALDE